MGRYSGAKQTDGKARPRLPDGQYRVSYVSAHVFPTYKDPDVDGFKLTVSVEDVLTSKKEVEPGDTHEVFLSVGTEDNQPLPNWIQNTKENRKQEFQQRSWEMINSLFSFCGDKFSAFDKESGDDELFEEGFLPKVALRAKEGSNEGSPLFSRTAIMTVKRKVKKDGTVSDFPDTTFEPDDEQERLPWKKIAKGSEKKPSKTSTRRAAPPPPAEEPEEQGLPEGWYENPNKPGWAYSVNDDGEYEHIEISELVA